MSVVELYGIATATVLIAVTLIWLASGWLEDASIIDVFWGPLFVAMAWVLVAVNRDDVTLKLLLFLFLVTAWGLRLAYHLGTRNLGRGEDARYRSWREQGGDHWWLKSFYRVYLLQGTIALLVATPIIAVFRTTPEFQPINWLGIAVWLLGFAVEAAADVQLTRFRNAPENRDQVMDGGLWRYSRHPNYFGDALQWWGLALLTFSGATWWTAIGPMAMTLLFLYLSNDILENSLRARRPGYEDYIARTSAFVPMLPRENRSHG
jgi:steroid 5-alpha reductase family enzyme